MIDLFTFLTHLNRKCGGARTIITRNWGGAEFWGAQGLKSEFWGAWAPLPPTGTRVRARRAHGPCGCSILQVIRSYGSLSRVFLFPYEAYVI